MSSERKEINTVAERPNQPIPKTTEGREAQLILLAIDQAEQQLRNGTASPSVLVHYLKLGSTREKAEREKLEAENQLLRAKAAAVERGESYDVMYHNILNAIRSYSPTPDDEDAEKEL